MLPQCVCISILLSNNEPQTDQPTLTGIRGGRTTPVSSLHTSCPLDHTPTVALIIIIIIQGVGIGLDPFPRRPQHERNNNDDTKAPLVGTIPLLVVSGRQSSLPCPLPHRNIEWTNGGIPNLEQETKIPFSHCLQNINGYLCRYYWCLCMYLYPHPQLQHVNKLWPPGQSQLRTLLLLLKNQ